MVFVRLIGGLTGDLKPENILKEIRCLKGKYTKKILSFTAQSRGKLKMEDKNTPVVAVF